MTNELVSLIIALCFTAIVAILAYHYPNRVSVRDSLAVGFLAYFTSMLVVINNEVDKLRYIAELKNDVRAMEDCLAVSEAIESGRQEMFDYFWSICQLKAGKGIYIARDLQTIEVPRDRMPTFWKQAIVSTDISWDCTVYVNDWTDLCSVWAKDGFEMQSMMKDILDVRVKRLFIFNSREELTDEIIDHIIWQDQDLGFNVRVIFINEKQRLAVETSFEKLNQAIGTLDIAIANESYLLAFNLSTDLSTQLRSLTTITLHRDPQLVEDISVHYQNIWESAMEVDEANLKAQ
jgi:hypothetical protein